MWKHAVLLTAVARLWAADINALVRDGLNFSAQGQYDKAAKCYREALAIDPKLVAAARAAFPAAAKTVTLGAPLQAGVCHPEPLVRVPLAMLNRHGLIAGATGTGKTKTLQLMAEQISAAGTPVFVADLKGYSILACGIGSLTQALGGDRAGAEAGTQKVLAELF